MRITGAAAAASDMYTEAQRDVQWMCRFCCYAGEIAAVIALEIAMTKTPSWINIASTVKSSQPTLQPLLIFDSHATAAQTGSATTGMRQNRVTTNHPGGAGICDLHSVITRRT